MREIEKKLSKRLKLLLTFLQKSLYECLFYSNFKKKNSTSSASRFININMNVENTRITYIMKRRK